MNSVDSPSQLVLSFPFVFFANGVSHLRLEIFDGIFDQVPTIGRLLSFQSSSERHDIPYPRERERERERERDVYLFVPENNYYGGFIVGKKTRSQNTNNIFLRCVHACITIEERESIPAITILRDHYCS